MGLLKPYDTVLKMISLARWQREWVNSHHAINFSGMVQDMIIDVIREHDPKYFEANRDNLDLRFSRRKENMPKLNHMKLYNNL